MKTNDEVVAEVKALRDELREREMDASVRSVIFCDVLFVVLMAVSIIGYLAKSGYGSGIFLGLIGLAFGILVFGNIGALHRLSQVETRG